VRSRFVIRYRRALIVAIHLGLVPAGYLAAYALRFDFTIPPVELGIFWATLPYLFVSRLAAFAYFGLYRGFWRHFSVHELIDLTMAVTLSTGLFAASLVATGWPQGMPRSVFVLDWVVAIFLFGGIRFAVRWAQEGRLFWNRSKGKRTLVVGAGEAAERLLRQFRHDWRHEHCVMGLIDDDPQKQGESLHGAPVLGTVRDLRRVAARHRIELVVIAIPSATREQLQRIVAGCTDTGIEFKILPSMRELLEGRARPGELRVVQLEDLLGRDPVKLDLEPVARDINDKVVLVTGGGGSIGSELARQIARFRPARLLVLDQAESPLYFIHLELQQANPGLDVVPVICDVYDFDRLQNIFAGFRPDYVFHAAAYKHVPMMEANVVEAVRNNVLGTLRVAQCAAAHGARKFVMISTDKAVNPSSVMGMTKRIGERIILGWPALHDSDTDFRVVRFGNVLGSDGSVVPLFRKQLAAGGPLTVTHPDVTRYFMTIPEAVQLVLQAATLSEAAGRIAMLEMGDPVRIVTLAENLIRLSGLVPYRDVQIVFSGLRPGEKLNEELMSAVEATVPTAFEKIRVVQTDEADGETIQAGVDRLVGALLRHDRDSLVYEMAALVPEYVPPRPIVPPVDVASPPYGMVAIAPARSDTDTVFTPY